MNEKSIFKDAKGRACVLRGVSILSGATRLAELAGLVGFDVIWIDMEHAGSDFHNAESLCVAAKAAGILPLVRTCDGQRTHVLRALEIGARILVVPMVANAETAARIVEYGKFSPNGRRGYNTRSRAVRYGIEGWSAFAAADGETYLFAQIETMEGIDNLDAICRVKGLCGIFIGPGDLSASIGMTGQFHSPRLMKIVEGVIRRAVRADKHVGILAPAGPMVETAAKTGADLLICGGDIADLTTAWVHLKESYDSLIRKAR